MTVVSSDPVRHYRKAIKNIKAYFQLRRRKFGDQDVTSKVVYNAETCRSRRIWPYLPLPKPPRPQKWTRKLPPTLISWPSRDEPLAHNSRCQSLASLDWPRKVGPSKGGQQPEASYH
uniref:Uncharacterized protein n=1 Tax=Trichogramma kaykai TaxID=54128 RepID=A0ABD2WZK1_9HYME